MQGGERWGRYSIIGLPAVEVLRVLDGEVCITSAAGESREPVTDPIAYIEPALLVPQGRG